MKATWQPKQQWTQRYTNFNSSLPNKYKVDRAILLSDKEYQRANLDKIKLALYKNNYPTDYINKIIRKRLYTLRHKQNIIEKKQQNQELVYKPFIYHPDITDTIGDILKKKTNIKINPKSVNILGNNIFTKLKIATPIEQQSNVIYKVSCIDCESTYIGQTKNYLKDRIASHIRSIQKGSHETALSQHSINKLHKFNFQNVKILDYEQKTTSRLFKEMICIKKIQIQLTIEMTLKA